MVASVDAGSVAVALIGVVVGTVLGFASSQIDTQLRRSRRGRSAARLIWFELMESRTTIREIIETRSPLLSEDPLPTAVWEAGRSAFAEVADGLALAHVALAYDRVKGTTRMLAGSSEFAALLKRAALPSEMPADSWLVPLEPHLKKAFEQIEVALVQLDRYSRLAKGPVDYSQLTSGREA